MYDAQGRWLPNLSPRGLELFEARERYLLAWGPRKTGKTIAVLDKLCRHAYEMPTTTIAIVALTLRVGRIGPWSDLQRFIIPQWEEANIGFRVTRPESWMPDTKMCYLRVTNAQGYETQIELHSCERPEEAEDRFKGGRWSFVYISEADTFPSPTVFDVLSDQLRNPIVPFESHQIVLDSNPAKQGKNHWLYKKFFAKEGVAQKSPAYAAMFKEMEFQYKDNPWLSDIEYQELSVKYDGDPALKARFFTGDWMTDMSDAVFGDVFRPNINVIGGPDPDSPGDYDELVPSGQSSEMIIGWDIGDRNHAAEIMAPRLAAENAIAYDLVDEVVHIDSLVSLGRFVSQVTERMDYWEEYMRATHKIARVVWRHWSDSSAFRFKSALDSDEQLEVARITDGRIMMHAVEKKGGSVEGRIMLIRKLLYEKRFCISHRCEHAIESLTHLKYDNDERTRLDTQDKYKHAFDAFSYAIASEIPTSIRPAKASFRKSDSFGRNGSRNHLVFSK